MMGASPVVSSGSWATDSSLISAGDLGA